MTSNVWRIRILLLVLLAVLQPLQAQVCGCRESEPAAPACSCCEAGPEAGKDVIFCISPEHHEPSDHCHAHISNPVRPEPRRQQEPRPLPVLLPIVGAGPVLDAVPRQPVRPVQRPLRPPCLSALGPRSPPLV